MWRFAWYHECCWRNLHTPEAFTKTRTFARNHQWQYRERRFRSIQKVKKAFRNEIDSSCRMCEKSHWQLWITLEIVGRMFEIKAGAWKKTRIVGWMSQMEAFFFSASIYHTSFMQWEIIFQSSFSWRRLQPSRERNVTI